MPRPDELEHARFLLQALVGRDVLAVRTGAGCTQVEIDGGWHVLLGSLPEYPVQWSDETGEQVVGRHLRRIGITDAGHLVVESGTDLALIARAHPRGDAWQCRHGAGRIAWERGRLVVHPPNWRTEADVAVTGETGALPRQEHRTRSGQGSAAPSRWLQRTWPATEERTWSTRRPAPRRPRPPTAGGTTPAR